MNVGAEGGVSSFFCSRLKFERAFLALGSLVLWKKVRRCRARYTEV